MIDPSRNLSASADTIAPTTSSTPAEPVVTSPAVTSSTTTTAVPRVGPSIGVCANVAGIQGLAEFDATGADPAVIEQLLAEFASVIVGLRADGDTDIAPLLGPFEARVQVLIAEFGAVGYDPSVIDASAILLSERDRAALVVAMAEFARLCAVDLSGQADEFDVVEPDDDAELVVEELLEELNIDEATARCLVVELDLADAGFDEAIFRANTDPVCGVVPADLVEV